MALKRNLATLDEFNTDEITNGYRDKYNKQNSGDEAVPLKNTANDERNANSRISVDVADDSQPDTYEGVILKPPRKYRIPFLIAVIVSVIFFIIIMLMIAFWPHIPYYMKGDLCVDKECLDASQQMLLWADTHANPCDNTYQWACGKFESEYSKHHLYGVHKGEWNFEAFHEYEEIKQLDFFISSLPSQGYFYNPSALLKGLYKSCRELETLDKTQANALLKKAINALDGWRLLPDGKSFQMWDYKKSVIHIQSIYGSFPFFKVSVGSRKSPPYNTIITLDEGEVGLPHKVYYSLGNNNEILDAYKMLLRDFAINMGIVGEKAETFADDVFHYEKRIVTKILTMQNYEDRKLSQIMTLGEIKGRAPLLPVFETVQATFPNTKISEGTEIFVRDIGIIEAMSIIISTSDRQPLNDFIVWSLARKFLPFMSREYRTTVEKFEKFLYGNKTASPQWFFCSKIVRDWITFAVDTLQKNPKLFKQTPATRNQFYQQSPKESLTNDEVDFNGELAKLIFYHIRNTLQEAIDRAEWINVGSRELITNKLSTISLQVGIPQSALESNDYVNEYYDQFLLQNLFFVEHLESLRRFEKVRMEKKLQKLDVTDAIIAELYPGYGQQVKSTGFLTDLNIAIVSSKLLRGPNFDYKYPISLNFARFGVTIADLLLKSISVFMGEDNYEETNLFGENIECLSKYIKEKPLPNVAIKDIFAQLSATNVAFKALNTFITLVDNSQPIIGAPLSESVSYENLGLSERKLQSGLRSFDEQQLFLLGTMQMHCSVSFEAYKKFKPYVDGEIAESELFELIWTQLPHITDLMSCSQSAEVCSDIL